MNKCSEKDRYRYFKKEHEGRHPENRLGPDDSISFTTLWLILGALVGFGCIIVALFLNLSYFEKCHQLEKLDERVRQLEIDDAVQKNGGSESNPISNGPVSLGCSPKESAPHQVVRNF